MRRAATKASPCRILSGRRCDGFRKLRRLARRRLDLSKLGLGPALPAGWAGRRLVDSPGCLGSICKDNRISEIPAEVVRPPTQPFLDIHCLIDRKSTRL